MPPWPSFVSTETVLEKELAQIKSTFPSALTSAAAAIDRPKPMNGDEASTKLPLPMFVNAALILAKEMRGPANIRVNVLSPGITAAGMAEASIASGKYDRFVQDATIARFGRAIDVARAVRFFLEPDNYVTGQVLCVDGGTVI